jgi:hypothetical protein
MQLSKKVMATAVAAIAVVATWAAPALADTSQATANAAQVTLSNSTLVTTGTFTASNDGTTMTTTGTQSPALSLLTGQSTLTAGVLAQNALAANNGTSVACAGAVGATGTIQIGTTAPCDVTQGIPLGVTIGGPTGIAANAILAFCTAAAHPAATATGGAQLIAASLGGTALPQFPAPNTVILGILTLNKQTHLAGGGISVTALDITLLGIEVKIGNVTCGPNAIAGAVSAFPSEGLPIAGGLLAIIGGAVFIRRRRRLAHAIIEA